MNHDFQKINLVEANINGFHNELLCNYMGKDKLEREVWINDQLNFAVLIDGKVCMHLETEHYFDVFDYIEATIDRSKQMICYDAEKFPKLMDKAIANGGEYSAIRSTLGKEKGRIARFAQSLLPQKPLTPYLEEKLRSAYEINVIEPEDSEFESTEIEEKINKKKYYKATWEIERGTEKIFAYAECPADVKDNLVEDYDLHSYGFGAKDYLDTLTISEVSWEDVFNAKLNDSWQEVISADPVYYRFYNSGHYVFSVHGKDAADALKAELSDAYRAQGFDWEEWNSIYLGFYDKNVDDILEPTQEQIEEHLQNTCYKWQRTPAKSLPDGWVWEDLGRFSQLKSPTGTEYFRYSSLENEQKPIFYQTIPALDCSRTPFPATHDTFQTFAEERIQKLLALGQERISIIEKRVSEIKQRERDFSYEEENDDRSYYGYEPYTFPAKNLPDGWEWEHSDGSGQLKSPDGFTFFSYECRHDLYIEYQEIPNGVYDIRLGASTYEFEKEAEERINKILTLERGESIKDKLLAFYGEVTQPTPVAEKQATPKTRLEELIAAAQKNAPQQEKPIASKEKGMELEL